MNNACSVGLIAFISRYSLEGENFPKLVENKIYVDCLLLPLPKDATHPNFAEKTFAKSYKTSKFAKVFPLESFPLYSTLLDVFCATWVCGC